jgi:cell division septal protein FtsQ
MRGGIYFDERHLKKRRRKMKIRIFCGAATFFALAIGAAYLAVWSPLFQIGQITVDADNGNLIENLKIFFVNKTEIARFLGPDNILIWSNDLGGFAKNPEIAGLKIEKDYSGRQIKISVQQREKFGIWCLDNGCLWFDGNGAVFGEAPQAEGNLINKVRDFSGKNLNPGSFVLEEKFMGNLAKIFYFLGKSGLGIRSLELKNNEFQEVETDSSPKIYFSLRFDPFFGLAAVNSLRQFGLDKVDYIDLRVENRAYYKLK